MHQRQALLSKLSAFPSPSRGASSIFFSRFAPLGGAVLVALGAVLIPTLLPADLSVVHVYFLDVPI